ncbi:uncharacterized protein LOC116771890 [Danaus plexippus]|uniref:uncharacterized protein LOC116771890 n=1 Tax=Danaus plexippus TaxID=13037 RepID=UPI002AB1B9AC|nr:uncharacterized protein LOC116771890 [Danaus plexippus]
MAKKKIELFINIDNEKEFENVITTNSKTLICADLYNSYAGPCVVLDHLFVRIKLDWSDNKIVLLRIRVDDISSLRRFKNHCEPVFIFILEKRITKIFRGVDNTKFAEVAKKEVEYFKARLEGVIDDRKTYNFDEVLPEEQEWVKQLVLEEKQGKAIVLIRKKERQAARKRHRAELMVPYLQHLNFVLYWPHAVHAHPELYERWDVNNIIMVGREEIQLTKEMADDILYAGDAPINEASMHVLLSGPALAICFRLLDTDKHFVSLVRKILYEDLTPVDESKPIEMQLPQKTAYDYYKSYSLTKEEIQKKRRDEIIKRKEEEREKRARRLSEMQRLARQAIEDTIEAKRAEKEKRKLELLKAGNLSALETLKEEPDDEEVDITIPEELSEEEEESSEEECADEYLPPAGLVIPGFYAPPNDISKANGLAILFPNLVLENVTPELEFLPPHVLVMLDITKRYKAIEAMSKYRREIIHIGIFKATNPHDGEHVAFSVKQFDKIDQKYDEDLVKLVFMVSIKSDLALLSLVDLGPYYVSADDTSGELECAAMFDVHYADNYNEFEDFSH